MSGISGLIESVADLIDFLEDEVFSNKEDFIRISNERVVEMIRTLSKNYDDALDVQEKLTELMETLKND